jgi:aspartyl protease family protein
MGLPLGARRAIGQAAAWGSTACCLVIALGYSHAIGSLTRGLFSQPRAAGAPFSRRQATSTSAISTPGRSAGGGRAEIMASAYGHFVARAEVNGHRMDVLVDSGASMVALSHEDARQAGIHVSDRDYSQGVRTANGVARVAPVVIDRISIGDVLVRNVAATVSEPGKLSTSLLGMSFLGRLNRVDMRSGVLVLEQ